MLNVGVVDHGREAGTEKTSRDPAHTSWGWTSQMVLCGVNGY